MKVKRYACVWEKFWGMARIGLSGFHSREEAQGAGEGKSGFLGVFEYETDAKEAEIGDSILASLKAL